MSSKKFSEIAAEKVAKYNKNHGKDGRFSSGSGGGKIKAESNKTQSSMSGGSGKTFSEDSYKKAKDSGNFTKGSYKITITHPELGNVYVKTGKSAKLEQLHKDYVSQLKNGKSGDPAMQSAYNFATKDGGGTHKMTFKMELVEETGRTAYGTKVIAPKGAPKELKQPKPEMPKKPYKPSEGNNLAGENSKVQEKHYDDWTNLAIFEQKKFKGKQDNYKTHKIVEETGVDQEKAKKFKSSLSSFTGSNYSNIRYAAVNGKPPDDVEKVKLLDEFISKSPKFKGEVFRGINIPASTLNQLKEGGVIDMKGNSSWSSSVYTAESFSNKGSDRRVIFNIVENKSGASIRHLSSYPNENEVLHSSTQKYRIKGIKHDHDKKYCYVEVEEV